MASSSELEDVLFKLEVKGYRYGIGVHTTSKYCKMGNWNTEEAIETFGHE